MTICMPVQKASDEGDRDRRAVQEDGGIFIRMSREDTRSNKSEKSKNKVNNEDESEHVHEEDKEKLKADG